MLITDDAIRREIPHEQYEDDPTREGEWMEFRRMSAKRLRKARKTRADEQREEAAGLIKILGPEFLESLQTGDRDRRARVVQELEELEYHISNFDLAEVLKASLVAWSYDEALPTDGDPTEMLDERTAVWAAKEAVAITRPPTEEEAGNSSRPSSSSLMEAE